MLAFFATFAVMFGVPGLLMMAVSVVLPLGDAGAAWMVTGLPLALIGAFFLAAVFVGSLFA